MVVIQKVTLTEEIGATLIAMSDKWEKEDSSFGYRANTLEDLQDQDIFLAQVNGITAGYLLCHIYVQEKDIATVPPGSRCLEIEELYVLPEYRSQGIGRKLYNEAAASYGEALDYVTLSTATKNYKAILHFYIEELNMTFWSARLFQKR